MCSNRGNRYIIIYGLLVYNVKYAKCFHSKFKDIITVKSHLTEKRYNPRTKYQSFYWSIPSPTAISELQPLPTWVTPKYFLGLYMSFLPNLHGRQSKKKKKKKRAWAWKADLTLSLNCTSHQIWMNYLTLSSLFFHLQNGLFTSYGFCENWQQVKLINTVPVTLLN